LSRKTLLRAALVALLASTPLASPAARALTLDQTLGGCNGVAPLRTLQANPSNYTSYVSRLLPGDRLLLAAGTYTQGLWLHNLNGQAGRCIVVEGPSTGSPALFLGSNNFNTVSLYNASYIAVRYLTLDGQSKQGDGVKAEGPSTYAHHITIERLTIKNHNYSEQIVGISTKSPAWNWVVRYNSIEKTGTGLYFGISDGSVEFVNGLIEHNLVQTTIAYNMEIKHQTRRRTELGIPASGTTIIRHNVWDKESGYATGTWATPNVLVGHWPLSGAGSTDTYQVYGNVFYQNPVEALFQGEGNVALYDNLFVNRAGPAIHIQPHHDKPRQIDIFHNTVLATTVGIQIYGGDPAYQQRSLGNAVFAATPISGGQQVGNVIGSYSAASNVLINPMAALGQINLYPKTGALQATTLDTTSLSGYVDWNLDFNGMSRIASFRGAYSGDTTNPGWQPSLAIMP
jgi:hypothetical protein